MVVELGVVRALRKRGAHRATEGSATQKIGDPLSTLVARSIKEFDRLEWDSLFPDELEDWRYLRAVERAGLEGCDSVYVGIRRGGRLVAAAPAFVGRRALAEPWRVSSRAQWRRARERMLVLGSPLSSACRVGLAPRAALPEQARLVESVLRAADEEAARLGLDGVFVSGDRTERRDPPRRFGATSWLARTRDRQPVRLSLPAWSFADYLSCIDEPLRGQLLRVCAQAAAYERDWCIDFDRDLEPMLALCGEAGLEELNGAYFRNLLGPDVCASCPVVRLDGKLVAFSLLLHDARVLREKLTIVSRRVKGSLVRSLLWLETLRYCLECGVATLESTSELSRSCARSTR